MSIRFLCVNPECGKAYTVKDECAGRRTRCPACRRPISVPTLGVLPGATAAAPVPADLSGCEPSVAPTSLEQCRRSSWRRFGGAGLALLVLGGSVTALVFRAAVTPSLPPVVGAPNDKATEEAPKSQPPPDRTPQPELKAGGKEDRPPNRKVETKPPSPPARTGKRPAPARPRADYEKLKESVVFVQGKHGHGSGFVVLPNVVATNSHVIRDDSPRDVTVRLIDASGVEESRKVKLLFEDKPRDLALLQLDTAVRCPPLPIHPKFVAGKEKEIVIIGNPGQGVSGLAAVNAVGTGVTDSIVVLFGKPFLQVRVSRAKEGIVVGPGNSGGPVFDPTGKVVGVLTSGLTRGGKPLEQFFCIPAHELKSALDGLGPAEGWSEVVEKATARHALDIAIAQLYLSSQLAKRILERREKVALQNRKWSAEDIMLIEIYKTLDKHSRELSQPAFHAVLTGHRLPLAMRNDLLAMRNNLEQIRSTVMKRAVLPGEHKRCMQAIDQNAKYFERLLDPASVTYP